MVPVRTHDRPVTVKIYDPILELAEERPEVDHDQSFEDAMKSVEGGASRRDEAFSKAFDRTQNLDDLLQKKFEEAKKKAAKDKSKKPFNPMDMD